jgi:hypothetical protein
MRLVRSLLVWTLITSIISLPCLAEDLRNGLALSKDLNLGLGAKGSEFVSGDYPGALLMKVNLWGAVNKSGIHYIPTQTDLVTLLSYAGGPTDRADLDSVSIKRYVDGKETIVKVDADKLLTNAGGVNPQLEANDIVVVPSKKPLITTDTAILIGAAGTIATVLLSAILVSQGR